MPVAPASQPWEEGKLTDRDPPSSSPPSARQEMLDERRERFATTFASVFIAAFILLLLVICANMFHWFGFPSLLGRESRSSALRGPGESYSDVILRFVEAGGGVASSP